MKFFSEWGHCLFLPSYPAILLADEPTGSVDTRTSDMIMDMFRSVNKELGTTIIIVTHDRDISKKVERVVAMRDGKTSSEFIMSYTEKLAGMEGFTEGESVEFAVLDKAGRVQIPRELLDRMGLDGNRLQVRMDDDNNVVLSAPKKVFK